MARRRHRAISLPRGRCSVCGADVALRRNGTPREHGRRPTDRDYRAGRLIADRPVCRGSGKRALDRDSDIGSAGSGGGDIATRIRDARAARLYVPLLVRWPRALLERVDAELARRNEGRAWYGRTPRAGLIRELVDVQLKAIEAKPAKKPKARR